MGSYSLKNDRAKMEYRSTQIQGADGTNKESFILYVDFALQQ